jgi:hypothetical protein
MTDTQTPEGEDKPGSAAAAAILLDQARLQMANQDSDLATLRTRAVALLSVSSLVAGLFGGRIVATQHHPWYVTSGIAVALVTFGLSVLAIIVVLSPKRMGWDIAQNLDEFFKLLSAQNLSPLDASANLAKHIEKSRGANQVVLEKLYCSFSIACVLTAVEVIAWGISIL